MIIKGDVKMVDIKRLGYKITYQKYVFIVVPKGNTGNEESISAIEKFFDLFDVEIRSIVPTVQEYSPVEEREKVNIGKKEEIGPDVDNSGLVTVKGPIECRELSERLETFREVKDKDIEEETKDKDYETSVPEEVDDKLSSLLEKDEGQRQAIQYLVQKYAKNKEKGTTKPLSDIIVDELDSGVDGSTDAAINITLIPKEEVMRMGRLRGKGKGEQYSMYEDAINIFIPDILDKISKSKDGVIRVRVADVAKQMGEKFIDKKPVTVYTGLKYSLFDHNIIVEMGSLKDPDPATGEDIKVLKMRMRKSGDVLPPSIQQRKLNRSTKKEV